MNTQSNHLRDQAFQCLMIQDLNQKCSKSIDIWHKVQQGLMGYECTISVETIPIPGRPAKPVLVPPSKLTRRKFSSLDGQAAMIHAICHIEFNAINLALDAVYRFSDMPDEFYDDWAEVAADEARHFNLLAERLNEMGYVYGDFVAHNGLWEMAVKTESSCTLRMGMVPRVLEARGLDVTPGIRRKFEEIGDDKTCEILDVILHEEIDHVAKGGRWFKYCCEQENMDYRETFKTMLKQYYPKGLQKPLNLEARLKAGFMQEELEAY